MSNEAFQAAIVDWLEREAGTVLVPTRRLGQALRHRLRQTRRQAGATGWERPRIDTLNQFIRRCWGDSWPMDGVAPTSRRLRLLHDLIDASPPPAGLRRTVALPGQVDRAFGLLARHELDPAAGGAHTPLSEWRARVCGRFAAELASRSLIHPATLPARVAHAIVEGAARVPAKVLVAGFATAAPIETQLFERLASHAAVEHLPLPAGKPTALSAASLPQQEQELIWLGQQVVDAAASGVPLSRIGIVLPDIPGYQEPVQRMLAQVLGRNEDDRVSYNVALSSSLRAQPLVRAGLLLLELASSPDRAKLVELLLSPYYGAWRKDRAALGRADTIWREARLDDASIRTFARILAARDTTLAERLVVESRPLSELLEPLAASAGGTTGPRRTSARQWVDDLRAVWRQLGFPVVVSEADRLAEQKLIEVAESLARGLTELELTGEGFSQWLASALAGESMSASGTQLAGVQVVGLTESRGLCFDRLLVPGMTATALPRPVRPLPLLSADERRHVQGGTAESERALSRAYFDNMLACADAIALCRPLTRERDPLAASPFWPVGLEQELDLDLWDHPVRAWLNADWVRQAWRGLGQAPQEQQEGVTPGLLPDELSVTKVESLLRCPLGFLIRSVLRLRPLEEPMPGIDAPTRGSVIHSILERFVDAVKAQDLDLVDDARHCENLLRKATYEVIDEQGGGLAWDVERRRLVGKAEAGEPGLLGVWLAEQRAVWQAGWRFRGAEVAFTGVALEGAPFRIRGSIDRVDEHPDHGLRVWDYKSGRAPSRKDVADTFADSQIVQYVAAVKTGVAAKADDAKEQEVDEPKTTGSFWELRSEKDVKAKLHKTNANFWDEVLVGFEAVLKRVAGAAAEGRFPAEPVPGDPTDTRRAQKVCEYCGAAAFCVPPERASDEHTGDSAELAK